MKDSHKHFKKMGMLTLTWILIILCMTSVVWAGEHYIARSGEKLARGASNLGLAIFEGPKVMEENFGKDQFAGLFIGAPAEALWRISKRIAVGAYEIVTFWHPQEPILKPVYVFPSIQEYIKESHDTQYDRP